MDNIPFSSGRPFASITQPRRRNSYSGDPSAVTLLNPSANRVASLGAAIFGAIEAIGSPDAAD